MCLKCYYDCTSIYFMIKTPLTFHSPETIYNFLEKQIGSLNMLIKKGWALITFTKLQNNEIALRKFKLTLLQGHPLRLTEFRGQEELDRKLEAMSVEPQEVAPPQKIIVQAPMSETAKMVQEAISIKDQNDQLEVITKKHFKEVLEYISKYTPIYTTAKSKEASFLANPSQNQKIVKDLQRFTEQQLSEAKKSVNTIYKKTRGQIAKFGQRQKEQIDLDPTLKAQEITNKPINAAKLELMLQYSNKEINSELKRMTALNQSQFICSTHYGQKSNRKAKLKVYSKEEEYELMDKVLDEGCYGLSLVDKFLLVGNQQGSISFWDTSQGNIEQTFEMSTKLHEKGPIFDILKYCSRPSGFSIITLAMDYNVKIFNVTEDLIIDQMKTLFFELRQSFCEEGGSKQIVSMDLFGERNILACTWSRAFIYDADKFAKVTYFPLKDPIVKVKTMGQNMICVGHQKQMSFIDPRQSNSRIVCNVGDNLKSVSKINQHEVCYGCDKGEVGLIDYRKPSRPLWKDNGTHNSKIYDILKMGDNIITGDQRGQIVCWSSIQGK